MSQTVSIGRKHVAKVVSDIPAALKEAASASLLSLLKSIDGLKDLVLDSELIWSLDYIAKVQQLKACGVEKIFKLEPGSSPGQTKVCVYVIRPDMDVTKTIADHVRANRHSDDHKNFWIIFVPRRLHVCDLILEREGVYGFVKMLEFPLGLIPVDSDLLSLELMDFFTASYLTRDQKHLHTVAMSLIQLQKLCGPIPKIHGHGKYSNMVVDMMKTMMNYKDDVMQDSGLIRDLLIFDRDIDYMSVLLSQLNYEGLLDETFDIKSGRVSFDKEVTGQDQVLKLVLNDEDVIFSEIRNCHFTSVLEILKEKAKQLQLKHDGSKLSLEDMKKIVAHKLKTSQQEKLLPLYIHTCEVIIKQKNESNFQEQLTVESDLIEGINLKETQTFIEEAINKQGPICCSLRLLCLLSIIQDGLPPKDYNSLAVQFLQSYGHKHMLTLHNLKKIGLLAEQAPIHKALQSPTSVGGTAAASKIAGKVAAAVASLPRQSSFKLISKKLSLIPGSNAPMNLKNPSSPSYVFSGIYVPIISKLTEEVICNDGFSKCEEAMKLLPGSSVHHELKTVSPSPSNLPTRVVVVYFLGGVAYAEVASLRLIGRIRGVKIIIATTSIMNGNSLMKLLMPKEL